MVREPAVAGKFYSANPDVLRSDLSSYLSPGVPGLVHIPTFAAASLVTPVCQTVYFSHNHPGGDDPHFAHPPSRHYDRLTPSTAPAGSPARADMLSSPACGARAL